MPNHLIAAEVSEFPAELQPYADQLEGRSMLVKRAAMFPVECVARGYLAGSGWKEYQAEPFCLRQKLPEGLLDGSRLPEPFLRLPPRARMVSTTRILDYAAMEAGGGERRTKTSAPPDLGIYARAAAMQSR